MKKLLSNAPWGIMRKLLIALALASWCAVAHGPRGLLRVIEGEPGGGEKKFANASSSRAARPDWEPGTRRLASDQTYCGKRPGMMCRGTGKDKRCWPDQACGPVAKRRHAQLSGIGGTQRARDTAARAEAALAEATQRQKYCDSQDGWLGPNARDCNGSALMVPQSVEKNEVPPITYRGKKRGEKLHQTRPTTCQRIGGVCACGEPPQVAAAAERAEPGAAKPAAASAPATVCAVIRTYDAHAAKIQAALETLLASVQARAGLTLEAHVINTDPRSLSDCFQRGVRAAQSKFRDSGHGVHEHHYVDPKLWWKGEQKPWWMGKQKPWWTGEQEFGYVATDLALLKLRQRGGCDYVLATNGDNIFHVDFFRRVLAEFDAHPSAAAVAVDFWCHTSGWLYASYQIKHVDLSAALFKASYLDSKNATFLLGAPKKKIGKKEWARVVYEADGWFAERILRDVGRERARVIHEGLFYHL